VAQQGHILIIFQRQPKPKRLPKTTKQVIELAQFKSSVRDLAIDTRGQERFLLKHYDNFQN
jgi:hypothetical protein